MKSLYNYCYNECMFNWLFVELWMPADPIPWKKMIGEITVEMVYESVIELFEYPVHKCKFINNSDGSKMIMTPKVICLHGGLDYVTDNPVFDNRKPGTNNGLYSEFPWGIDSNGDRYYTVDINTGMPHNFEKVINEYIISIAWDFLVENNDINSNFSLE